MANYKEYLTGEDQHNYGWGLTLNLTGKAPAVAKRIWATLNDAKGFIADPDEMAVAGILLRVIKDGKNNGVYQVIEAPSKPNGLDLEKLAKGGDTSTGLASARTEVKEGTDSNENMSIAQTTGTDGHDIYTINLSNVGKQSDINNINNKIGIKTEPSISATTIYGAIEEVNKELIEKINSNSQKVATKVNAKNSGHVTVKVVNNPETGDVVTIEENDIASAQGLTSEIARATGAEQANANAITAEMDARKTVTGVNGDICTYSGTNYLNGQTSLHAADVLLDGKIKSNETNIGNLTKRVSANETNIGNITKRVSDNETNIGNIKSDITNITNGTTLDGKYVNVTGDTMTGNLTINNGGLTVTGATSINGGLTVTGTITATGAIYSSDRRLKSDIVSINENDINSIKNIDLKSYRFTNDKTNRERYGVIAQDLEENHLSNLVVEAEGKKGVDYVSFLILKIAQLEKEIEELKNR